MSSNRSAAIFGADDRRNVVEYSQFKGVLNWSNAVAVLGPRTGSTRMCHPTATQGYCYLNTKPITQGPIPDLESASKLCPGERFSQESFLDASCTAFHVGNGRFLSAGHCVSDATCNLSGAVNMDVAFGYRIVSFSSETRTPVLPKRTHRRTNVFSCSSIVDREEDLSGTTGVDWVVFDVAQGTTKQVPVHRTLRIHRSGAMGQPLATLGHGLGLPQKISTTGLVRSVDAVNRLFRYTGDVFNGDSGGPTIDMNTGRAAGIVTAVPQPIVGSHFVFDSAGQCYRYAPACDPVLTGAGGITMSNSLRARVRSGAGVCRGSSTVHGGQSDPGAQDPVQRPRTTLQSGALCLSR